MIETGLDDGMGSVTHAQTLECSPVTPVTRQRLSERWLPCIEIMEGRGQSIS